MRKPRHSPGQRGPAIGKPQDGPCGESERAGYRKVDLMDPQVDDSVGTLPQLVYTVALRMRPPSPQPASRW